MNRAIVISAVKYDTEPSLINHHRTITTQVEKEKNTRTLIRMNHPSANNEPNWLLPFSTHYQKKGEEEENNLPFEIKSVE